MFDHDETHGDEARAITDRDIDKVPEVHPLDALRANSELVRLLSGWQWQAIYDARWRGATPGPRSPTPSASPSSKRPAGYGEVIDRQERLLGRRRRPPPSRSLTATSAPRLIP